MSREDGNSRETCPERRATLTMLGLGVLAAGLPRVAAAAAAAPASSDADATAKATFDAMVKLRGSLDERPVFMWMLGRRYAVAGDGMVHPICAAVNCSLTRWRRVADDRVALTVLEYNFNTDFETGEWRDELTMPITGRRVKAPEGAAPPVIHEWRASYRYDGTVAGFPEVGPAQIARLGGDSRITVDRRMRGPQQLGEEVAFIQDWYSRVQSTKLGRTLWTREIATVRGSARDVMDPRVRYAPSRTSYSIMYDFQPWMQLEGVPGHVLTSAIGGKTLAAAELPPEIRDLLGRRHPEALGAPEKLLDAAPAHG